MTTEIWVELFIEDFALEPKQITTMVGLQPTKIKNKGETYRTPNGKEIVVPFNYWGIESDLPETSYLSDHLENLLGKLRPHKEKLIQLFKDTNPFLYIILHINDKNRPDISLDRKIIKELSDYNTSVGFDYSFYGDL